MERILQIEAPYSGVSRAPEVQVAISQQPMSPGDEIRLLAVSCRQLFTSCVSQTADEFFATSMRTARGDFNLWCTSIKAASLGRDSLDYHLSNHSNVRDVVCGLLAGLQATLAKYQQSANGKYEQLHRVQQMHFGLG